MVSASSSCCRLSIPISVALAGSLLVALVFIPLSVYLTLPTHKEEAKKPHPVFNWLKTAYDRPSA